MAAKGIDQPPKDPPARGSIEEAMKRAAAAAGIELPAPPAELELPTPEAPLEEAVSPEPEPEKAVAPELGMHPTQAMPTPKAVPEEAAPAASGDSISLDSLKEDEAELGEIVEPGSVRVTIGDELGRPSMLAQDERRGLRDKLRELVGKFGEAAPGAAEAAAKPFEELESFLTKREEENKTKIWSLVKAGATGAAAPYAALLAAVGQVAAHPVETAKSIGGGITQIGKDVLALNIRETSRSIKSSVERAKAYREYLADQKLSNGEKLKKLVGDSGRALAEGYRKMPPRYKVLLTGAIVGATAASGGSLALYGLMAGQRALGGATFAMNQREKMEKEIAANPEHAFAKMSEDEKRAYFTTMAWSYFLSTSAVAGLAAHEIGSAAQGHSAHAEAVSAAHAHASPPVEHAPHHEAPPTAPVSHEPELPKIITQPQHDADVRGWHELNPDKPESEYPGDAAAEQQIIAAQKAAEAAGAHGASVPHSEMPAEGVAHGHGYEYSLKREAEAIWEKHIDPNTITDKTSDLYKLVTANKDTIDGVVHRIAIEHHFYNADGTSVAIDPNAHLTIGADGSVHFSDPAHPDIVQAPEHAPVTPPYHPAPEHAAHAEAAPAGHTYLPGEHVRLQEQVPVPAPRPDIEHAQAPGEGASGHAAGAAPAAGEVAPPAAARGAEAVPVDAQHPEPPIPGHPEIAPNSHGLRIDASVVGRFTNPDGSAQIVYGGPLAERGQAALDWVAADHKAVVYFDSSKPGFLGLFPTREISQVYWDEATHAVQIATSEPNVPGTIFNPSLPHYLPGVDDLAHRVPSAK